MDDASTTTRASVQANAENESPPDVDASTTEPPPAPSTRAPVGVNKLVPRSVGETAEFGNGLVARVEGVRLVDAEAFGPGETSGPAVAVDLELANMSNEPIDMAAVAVDVNGPDGEVGIPNQGETSRPLQGMLQPGEERAGTYVFRLNEGRAGVVIDVYHAASENVVVIQS